MTTSTGLSAWRAATVALLLLWLTGCATLSVPDYASSAPEGLPRQVELTDVPFHPQDAYQCGPATLATVLEHAGVARTPAQLVDEVYLPARQGSLQFEMLGAVRRAGLLPYRVAPQADALLQEVAAGNPVVVLQNLRFDWFPQWHYAVVVGYNLSAGELVLRSGGEKRLTMPIADFDRSWAKSGRWAFVALPSQRLPATAREAEYVAAVADLERVAPAAARQAYRRALAVWPTNLFARLALGNAAYRQHLLDEALTEYRQATLDHPEAADAWNNLAQILHESGRGREAREAAARAVAIGGARLETYRATQTAVEAGGRR